MKSHMFEVLDFYMFGDIQLTQITAVFVTRILMKILSLHNLQIVKELLLHQRYKNASQKEIKTCCSLTINK